MHTHINSVDNNLLITCVLFMTECNTPPLHPTEHLYNSELNLAVRWQQFTIIYTFVSQLIKENYYITAVKVNKYRNQQR